MSAKKEQPVTDLKEQGAHVGGDNVGHNKNEATNMNYAEINIHNTIVEAPQPEKQPVTDLKEQEEKLREVLKERVMDECASIPMSIDRDLNIQPVPIQMKQGYRVWDELEEYGHYNRKKEFEEIVHRYEGNITLENLFDRAFTTATKKANSDFEQSEMRRNQKQNRGAKPKDIENDRKMSERKRKNDILKNGNTVMLVGQAGIGKTTLARQLAKHVMNKNILPGNEYIFYIPFREVDFSRDSTVLQYLVTGCRWDHSLPSNKQLLEKLHDNPNMLFILDGLDEANTDQFSQPVKDSDFFGTSKPYGTVKKLLSGKWFPHSKKLVTSRPRQALQMHPSYIPDFIVHILGLNKESRMTLAEEICGDMMKEVEGFLQLHPNVLAACYVPAKCIVIMYVLQKRLSEGGNINILSLTDIFVEALTEFVASDKLRGKDDLFWKLANLALNGLLSGKITFTEADLRKCGLGKDDLKDLEAFLVTVAKAGLRLSLFQRGKISFFSHLIWLEIFAALCIIFLLSKDELLGHLPSIDQPRWEVVSKFLYGLCNPTVNNKIKIIFPEEVCKDIEAKKQLLYDELLGTTNHESTDLISLIQICDWIHEANDPDLNNKVKFQLPAVIKFSNTTPIFATDLCSLMYVLRLTKPYRPLEDGRNIHLLERLDVCYTNIEDDGVKIIAEGLCHIKELKLGACEKITTSSMQCLGEKLAELQRPMKLLYLRGNGQLGDEGARAITLGLHNVVKLSVGECGISAVGTRYISNALNTLQLPINELTLGNTKELGDEGVKPIATAMRHIEKLFLYDCGITAVGARYIGDALNSLQLPMKSLYLSNNDQIGDEGARAIASGLRNVEELYLSDCGITGVGGTCIGNALKNLENPMKLFDLHSNQVGDEGARALADGLCNVEELDIYDCGIAALGANYIGKALKTLRNPIKGIYLSFNQQMGDDGAKGIAVGLRNVEKLDLDGCGITAVGAKYIGEALKALQDPKPTVEGLEEWITEDI